MYCLLDPHIEQHCLFDIPDISFFGFKLVMQITKKMLFVDELANILSRHNMELSNVMKKKLSDKWIRE